MVPLVDERLSFADRALSFLIEPLLLLFIESLLLLCHRFPSYSPISSSSSSGVMRGPPAAALAWRAIVLALDWRVMPFSLRSRAIIALRMSRMAVSRNSTIVSRGHAVSGCDQSMMAQPFARSGKIAATAPASQGSGSSAVRRIVCSVSSCSAAACSARLQIQANNIAARIHPHSVSLRRPIGVPGGDGSVELDDSARSLDRSGGSASLPFVLERRHRDLADGAGLFHQRAHAGGVIGTEPAGAEVGAAAAAA